MTTRNVLITGGAGFIGSRLTRELISRGHEVSILDNFSPQIHGDDPQLAADLRSSVRLFRGDVRDEDLCRKAMQRQEVLVHLAAETGTGQSMYSITKYSDVNIGATAMLMELLLTGEFPVQNIVVASSRAVYGEGAAICAEHGLVYPAARSVEAMKHGQFEPMCPKCGRETTMTPTSEEAPFQPSSFYGLTKQVQEQMALMYAGMLGINGFALRYQNVYGPGQSMKNPYTGILAIFSNQARTGEPIYIFEDGRESRDFVYIDDVVEATTRCVESPARPPVALNVGTGRGVAVAEVVKNIVGYFESRSPVSITGAFRQGDIRHNCAEGSKLLKVLDFAPSWSFEDGIRGFLAWAETNQSEPRLYERSLDEMRAKGLLHG